MKNIKIIGASALLLISNLSFGQLPREVQVDNDPVDWSNPWTLAFCVGVPVLLIIGGIYIRSKRKK